MDITIVPNTGGTLRGDLVMGRDDLVDDLLADHYLTESDGALSWRYLPLCDVWRHRRRIR
ncbi:MAG: hypothetical protein ACR2HR_03210 [Euzebya sp.]